MKIERTANFAGSAEPLSDDLAAPWRATFFRATQPWKPYVQQGDGFRGCFFFRLSAWGEGRYERATRPLVPAMCSAATRADTAQVFEPFVEQDVRWCHSAHAVAKDRDLH